jgi:hypothetical protein
VTAWLQCTCDPACREHLAQCVCGWHCLYEPTGIRCTHTAGGHVCVFCCALHRCTMCQLPCNRALVASCCFSSRVQPKTAMRLDLVQACARHHVDWPGFECQQCRPCWRCDCSIAAAVSCVCKLILNMFVDACNWRLTLGSVAGGSRDRFRYCACPCFPSVRFKVCALPARRHIVLRKEDAHCAVEALPQVLVVVQ